MWKLIIFAMLIAGNTTGGADIEIWETDFKSERTCQLAAEKLSKIEGHLWGSKGGKFKVWALCFKYR